MDGIATTTTTTQYIAHDDTNTCPVGADTHLFACTSRGAVKVPKGPFCLYTTLVLGSAHASLPTHVMSRLRASQPLDSLVCAELATVLVEVHRFSLDHCTAPTYHFLVTPSQVVRLPLPRLLPLEPRPLFFIHNALSQSNCLPLEASKIPPTNPNSYKTLTLNVPSHG
ncbi:uncharacterized protein LY79DRAFT_33379 [Colletotrichum navitas]|uniref:Uncharacterized protein n=1 Tax=Colletotrichum navitas TaxID=681940 RepID=A0AAD8Q993_9PEZI|nr:uncharacterized protein LY79DRAFT_33379 [Colletotrichum navitas]KAK1596849.1 hypothetical protein LY79DRAFT_33379 [Colletotrichum navitas]